MVVNSALTSLINSIRGNDETKIKKKKIKKKKKKDKSEDNNMLNDENIN